MDNISLRVTALAGDIAVLAAFPFIGAMNHEDPVSFESFMRTAVPFAIAWLVVGVASTSFVAATIRSRMLILQRVLLALVGSGVVAIAIRVTLFDAGMLIMPGEETGDGTPDMIVELVP